MEKQKGYSPKEAERILKAEMQRIGSNGGKVTAAKGQKYMSELGKKGAESRWGVKKPLV